VHCRSVSLRAAAAALLFVASCTSPKFAPIPDEATRRATLNREATCAPATRRGVLPLIRFVAEDKPLTKDRQELAPVPPELAARKSQLAACLGAGEQVAFQVSPEGGTSRVKELCQAASPSALTCVRKHLETAGVSKAVSLFLAGPEIEDDPRLSAYQDAFRRNWHDFEDCYRGLTRIFRDAEGEVVLALFVGSSGAVEATDVLQNTTGVHELACCIENRLSEWNFGEGGCRSQIVRIPFRLRP
jgi:hypothetical protein